MLIMRCRLPALWPQRGNPGAGCFPSFEGDDLLYSASKTTDVAISKHIDGVPGAVSKMTCVVPSRHGILNWYRTLPFGVSENRFSDTADLAIYRHNRSRPGDEPADPVEGLFCALHKWACHHDVDAIETGKVTAVSSEVTHSHR